WRWAYVPALSFSSKSFAQLDLEHATEWARIGGIEAYRSAREASLIDHKRRISVEQVLNAKGYGRSICEPRPRCISAVETDRQIKGRVGIDLSETLIHPDGQLIGVHPVSITEVDEAVCEQSAKTKVALPTERSTGLER